MEFKISRMDLQNALRDVSRAISSRPVVPALSGVHILASEQGLTLTGSNSDLSIRKFIPNDRLEGAEIIQEGSIILPARELLGIARSMPDFHISVKSMDETQVQITSGKSVFNLNGVNGNEYPNLPDMKGEGFSVEGESLKSLIDKTIYAVSKTESRPILTGVNMFFDNNDMGMVATDAHRLSKVVGGSIEGDQTFENITLPEKSLKEVSTLTGGAKEVTLKQVDNQMIFETENLHIRSRLLEGNFPETDRLIPMDHTTLLTVDRVDFLSSMERSAILADGDTNIVTFKITDENRGIFETIELSHQSAELGQSKEDIIVEKIEGEEITLSFNPEYVIEALKKIDDDKVVIEFNGPMRPFIIKPVKKDNFIQLILPVRTYG